MSVPEMQDLMWTLSQAELDRVWQILDIQAKIDTPDCPYTGKLPDAATQAAYDADDPELAVDE